MTTATFPEHRPVSPDRPERSAVRTAARIAGIAYIGTFVFSIPVKFGLWRDVLELPDWVLGAGNDGGIALGALFEILTAITGVVTAVALYPVVRRHGERRALGFVTTRVLEAGLIFVGVLAIMATFTLRTDIASTTDADSLVAVAGGLVAIHDWAFLLGPGVMSALNALLIGSIMYRSRMLPRWIPTLGLVGSPLLLLSDTATLFGVWEQTAGPAMLLVLPIAIWEFSFGVHMVAKGLRPASGDTEMSPGSR